MTPDQAEAAEERRAIMQYDGKCTEAEIEAYLRSKPEIYGVQEVILEKQELIADGRN